MKCVKFALLAFAATLLAVGVYAQATGSIEGRVTDETKAPLPGVTIEATSPTLATARTAVSEANGKFTFASLPAGTYSIRCVLQGFATLEQANINVAAGSAATLQVQMQSAVREEVTVTGTLIPRPTLEAMSPVTTMDVEAITYAGNTRLEDMLTTLPQIFSAQNSTVSNGSSGTATINLRNMGSVRTLVLIDGQRMPAGDAIAVAPDLNFIPAGLVKRVDLLTGGASSTYGADAVAGVVNFIVDKDFEGIRAGIYGGGYNHNNNDETAREINAPRNFTVPEGMATDGGQFEAYVSLGGKFAEGKGHGIVYLDYRKAAALRKDRRDYTNCSVGALGATGLACSGSSTSATGRFWTDDGSSWTVDPTQERTFIPWSTSKYSFNYNPYNFAQRPDTRWAGGGFLDYEWNPRYHAYGSVMLMDDTTDAQIAPSGSFGSTLYINCDNPMMSAQMKQIVCTDNGYGPGVLGPDGVDNHAGLQVFRRNVEGGGRMDKLSHQAIRLNAGLKGDLGAGWSYDISGLYAHTRIPETYINDFNATRLQEALFVQGDPDDPSTWACTSGNPNCIPWDIFTPGGVTQEQIAYLNLPMLSNGSARSEMVLGTVTADLGQAGLIFPGATEGLSLALGADYRKEFIDFQTDLAYQTGIGAGQGATTPSVTGFYDVKELFAELLIPFVQGARGAQELSVNLGYRYSDYNVNGVHPTYKAEGVYAPSPSFKFRAGYNRATRAPNVVELYQPQRLVLGGSNDPCTNEEGDTPQFSLEQCLRTGVTAAQYGHLAPSTAGQYNTWSGGNPALDPEVADTTTLGLVFTPAGTSLSIALDYYDIQLDETISTLGFDDIVSQCGLTGDPALCNLIHRDHFGSLWRLQSTQEGFVDTLNDNVGKKEAEGIDLNASYTLPAGNTFFSFTLQGTYSMTAFTDTGLYQYDCVGWTGNKCNNPYLPSVNMQPEWRHLFRVSWQTGGTVITLGWRYLGPVKAEEASDEPALAAPEQIELLKLNEAYEYSGWNWFDLAVGFQLAKGIQFNFGINNILDKQPPRGAGSEADDYAKGFYGSYDPYGRYIHSSIQFSF
jgi:outer membrane receptor protein involved in Fe transport